jgi:hypothetical protein
VPKYLEMEKPRIFWYPSFGNKGYPYSHWEFKRDWSIVDTLKFVGEIYNGMYRVLRISYKWSPDVVDKIDIYRYIKIYNECVEEAEKKRKKISEEDIEEM